LRGWHALPPPHASRSATLNKFNARTTMATATRFQTNLLDETYNGWTNYKTWNVALWIQNDESIHNFIQENDVCCYEELLESLYDCGSKETPDGVKWNDPEINRIELNGDLFDL